MELIKGQDLYSYCESKKFNLDESEVIKIVKKISSVLLYLKKFGIVHRDIKHENILLTENNNNYDIKVIDFGLGIILGPGEKSNQALGTITFLAPEALLKENYDFSVDIWSMGILTYSLLVGKLPFVSTDDNIDEINGQIFNEPVPFNDGKWSQISEDAKNFVSKCLEKSPSKRFTINEIVENKWLKKYI